MTVAIKIEIRTTCQKKFTCSIESNQTVADLKQMVRPLLEGENQTNREIRLILAGKYLGDNEKISDLGLLDSNKLFIVATIVPVKATNTNPNPNTNTSSNTNSNTNPNSNTNSNTNSNPNTNSNTNSNPNTNTNTNTNHSNDQQLSSLTTPNQFNSNVPSSSRNIRPPMPVTLSRNNRRNDDYDDHNDIDLSSFGGHDFLNTLREKLKDKLFNDLGELSIVKLLTLHYRAEQNPEHKTVLINKLCKIVNMDQFTLDVNENPDPVFERLATYLEGSDSFQSLSLNLLLKESGTTNTNTELSDTDKEQIEQIKRCVNPPDAQIYSDDAIKNAYFNCEKNVDYAINYLFDNQ